MQTNRGIFVSKLSASILTTCLLSCALGSGPVFAQSTVSLYGLGDVFLGSVKAPGAHAAAVQQGGGMSTSYWGLAGKEDLGDNYSAFFILESYFQPNNGTYGRFSGDGFFSRNAYVGLASPYGSIRAGLLTTPLYIATISFNSFSNSYTFSPWIYHTYKGLGAQGVVGDSVWENAVAYTSPTWAGLNATAIYSFGNSATDGGAHKWGAQLSYVYGNLAASANYQYINYISVAGDIGKADAAVPGLKNETTTQIDASYNFNVIKFFTGYMNIRDDATLGTASTNSEQIGASVPVGTAYLLAALAYSKSSGANSNNDRRTTWSVGYDYPLSKRTDVYTAFKYDHFAGESTGLTYGVGMRTRF
jgi:predicted porin